MAMGALRCRGGRTDGWTDVVVPAVSGAESTAIELPFTAALILAEGLERGG